MRSIGEYWENRLDLLGRSNVFKIDSPTFECFYDRKE